VGGNETNGEGRGGGLMWKGKRDERGRWRKKEEEEGKGYRSCELYNLIKKRGLEGVRTSRDGSK